MLPQLGDHLSEVALEGLRRGEVLQPEAVRLLGLTVGTDWPAVAPALRDHRCRQLVAVLTGNQQPDAADFRASGRGRLARPVAGVGRVQSGTGGARAADGRPT